MFINTNYRNAFLSSDLQLNLYITAVLSSSLKLLNLFKIIPFDLQIPIRLVSQGAQTSMRCQFIFFQLLLKDFCFLWIFLLELLVCFPEIKNIIFLLNIDFKKNLLQYSRISSYFFYFLRICFRRTTSSYEVSFLSAWTRSSFLLKCYRTPSKINQSN